ncbi:DUF2290 domain-containing protein [Yersinia enterocolitica]
MTKEDIIRFLDYIGSEYSKVILSSNYCQFGEDISWGHYNKGIYNRILYSKEYETLLNERQYSFLLKDKSFIQFYYKFDDKELIKARLCYYPYPLNNKEDDVDLSEYLEESGSEALDVYYYGFIELIEHGIISTNSSHIRFDYDSGVKTHCKSHIQYSGLNTVRIPMNHVINPLIFFDFIITNTSLNAEVQQVRDKRSYSTNLRQAEKNILHISSEKGLHLNYINL